MANLFQRLLHPFRRRRFEADMAEEMQAHLEMQAAANRAAGVDADEARYAARRQFGGVDQIKEIARAQRGWVWLDQLLRDLRHTGRMLRRHPGFTAAAVSSLALCIGANTAVFSMLYGLVIRPLPLPDSGRLVEVYNTFPKVGMPKLFSNLGQYLDFKRDVPAFASLGLWHLDYFTLGDTAGPLRVPGAVATADLFGVLGVQPLRGRFFSPENQVPGADRVVVLTESFWRSHYDSDPAVVGRTLRIDGEPFEVIGIAPRLLETFDARVRIVRPLSWPAGKQFEHTGYSPQLFGRLRPGATLDQARAQLGSAEDRYYASASAGIRDFYDRTGHRVCADTVRQQRAAPVRGALLLLQGGALAVLLIGCVNVANLLVARAAARSGEFAMRLALGASRAALVRQLLAEGALLAGLGAGGGLLLAWQSLGAANHFTAQLLPDAAPISLNGHVLVVATSFALVVTLLISLGPVAHLGGRNHCEAIHRAGRTQSTGRGARALGAVPAIAQIALALVLLAGGGLLLRSLIKALAVEPGFLPAHLVAARIAVPRDKEKTFPLRLEAGLRAIPGLKASLASTTPFILIPPYDSSMPLGAVAIRGAPVPPGGSLPSVYYSGADSAYLDTLRIALRAGRWFDARDLDNGRAVVVDESFARRYFPDGSAVGGRLVINAPPPDKLEDWKEIVGVVGDVRHNGVEEKSGHSFVYLPITQMPLYGNLSVLVRTNRPAAEVALLLREQVARIDPELPVYEVETMERVIDGTFTNRRGILLLLAGFAGLALLLAAIGSYGVLAYDVSRRTREVGIRAAVGATRGQIVALFMRQGLWRAGVGIAVGLAGAAALSRLATSLLFDVRPTDPLVYGGAVLVLLAVAALANWLPARQAARVDPVTALRAE